MKDLFPKLPKPRRPWKRQKALARRLGASSPPAGSSQRRRDERPPHTGTEKRNDRKVAA